ncbi:uncharacterized protein LOC130736269 [Lotus japonicus]|uniref:uncharacterized protein LOC130736269 n=1 Tax=Lotus japonicus TaxID=34305 RepID=UPI00258E8391|nr:uncharacterized protein LOC130736269 [Lotus japonicus]
MIDAIPVESNPGATIAIHSPLPGPTPIDQSTSHISPPRPSFFQPSIQEEPLWQMLQTPKSTEQNSLIILPYPPTASKTQALETQTSEKQDSEPKHSDRETLSPAPSVSFPTNVAISSSSNNSETTRQFFQVAHEKLSEIPEYYLNVPSPRQYPGPRPEPMVAPDFPIRAVPLTSVSPPRPLSPPPEKEKSVSNHSSVKSPNP